MSSTRASKQALTRGVTGAKQGLLYGLAYGAYALILLIFRGVGILDASGLGFLQLLALYLFGGIAAGAICGVLEPLTGSLVGRVVVGMIAALPAAFLIAFTVLPAEDIGPNLVPVGFAAAVLWGVIGGTMFWYTRD